MAIHKFFMAMTIVALSFSVMPITTVAEAKQNCPQGKVWDKKQEKCVEDPNSY